MKQCERVPTVIRVVRLGNAATWLRNQILRSEGLTASQGEVIRYILRLYKKRDLTAQDLVEELGLSQSTVAGILKRLESKELITRTTDETDGRRSILAPTQKGLELQQALRKSMNESEKIMLQGMTPEEISTLDVLLQKGLNNISALREKERNKSDE